MEARDFEKFQKNQKSSKIRKMPTIVSKNIQTCFEHALGQIFMKNFMPSVPWRFESSKLFKKIEKFSKFQKGPKSFPKVSKRVLNMFWGEFSKKNFFCPVFHGDFEKFQKNRKIFNFPKMPKTVPKSIQTCFERVLR